jgi:hypothetical protein
MYICPEAHMEFLSQAIKLDNTRKELHFPSPSDNAGWGTAERKCKAKGEKG